MTDDGLSHHYDRHVDVLTIEGIRYSGEVFRQLGGILPVGQAFTLVARDDGLLTIQNASQGVRQIANDPVSNPKHYTSHPSGVECIQITEHMSFTLGNAIKYLWRADEKGAPIEDLKKAVWYIQREIARRETQESA